jgi:signal transduction histidine kinase
LLALLLVVDALALVAIGPRVLLAHDAVDGRSLGWALVYAVALIGGGFGLVTLWRAQRQTRTALAGLATELGASESARSQLLSERQQATSDLLVSLARRNQALLYRQLSRIDAMEAEEEDPSTLSALFAIDHLATRMRRNAESLLVLSGEESARRLNRPVSLAEVIRGAVAEIEDFARVDVTVQGDAELLGHAVVDVVHLLAELIENAAVFSPPSTRVTVSGLRQRDGYVITITDRGVGFTPDDLEEQNKRLAAGDGSEDLTVGGMLGFRVVSRLSARYDIHVRLASQTDQGTVATVSLPAGLLQATSRPTGPAAAGTEPMPAVGAPAAAGTGMPADAAHAVPSLPRQYLPDGVAPAPIAALATDADPLITAKLPAIASTMAAFSELHDAPVGTADVLAPEPAAAAAEPDQPDQPEQADPEQPEALEQVPQPDASEPDEPLAEHTRSLLAAYSQGLALGRTEQPAAAAVADRA